MLFNIEFSGESTTTLPGSKRKRLDGTPQQEDFWLELLTGTGHVVLEARAGAGKSSSCREGMWRILEHDPRSTIRYCCFNKKIADEFSEKCPIGVEVGTMHRFGLQALGDSFAPKVDKQKTYMVLDSLGGSDLKRYIRKSISILVGLAKNHGLGPEDEDLRIQLDEIIDYYDVECWYNRKLVIDWAGKVLKASAELTSIVDFDDMLWLCTLYPVRFPSCDFLFIDEVQDTNPVQHKLAELLSGSGRTIVVGDPFQAIYGFRGADSDSIPKLRARLNATVMPLTVSFRCPRSHVELARKLVPDLEAAPGAKEGLIEDANMGAIDDVLPGDLVLCRANAPIIAACLRQIGNLVPATVRGRAIGDMLLGLARKMEGSPTVADFCRRLEEWRSRETMRLEAKEGSDDIIEQVNDKASSLDAIASACSSPAEIPACINELFSDDDAENRVTFSSVHRAKGSESRSVVYIQIPYSEKKDKLKPPQPWVRQQRNNLRYVALTRSLDWLTLIS